MAITFNKATLVAAFLLAANGISCKSLGKKEANRKLPLLAEVVPMPDIQCSHNQIYISYTFHPESLREQITLLQYYLQYGSESDFELARGEDLPPDGVRWRDICALIYASLCKKELAILTSDSYEKRDQAIRRLLKATR